MGQKIRKNAVPAIDICISASPEYFRPGNPGKVSYWEEDRFEDWLEANRAFLTLVFGEERLLQAECYLDEAKPHIHAVMVPLIDESESS